MSVNDTTSGAQRATEHHVVIEYHASLEPEQGTVVLTGDKADCEINCVHRTMAFDIEHVVKPESFAEKHDLDTGVVGDDPEYTKEMAERFRQ